MELFNFLYILIFEGAGNTFYTLFHSLCAAGETKEREGGKALTAAAAGIMEERTRCTCWQRRIAPQGLINYGGNSCTQTHT